MKHPGKMTVIKLGCKIMECYKNVKNWDPIIMPSCGRFSSIVWVSISDPEPRFINMVLFSAMLNRLTYLFSKTATTFDLCDSDFRICKGRMHLYSWYWSLMLHICCKEFKFWAWSALPMVHLVTASLSAENLLMPPMVLESLFSNCSSCWSTAV